MTFPLRFVAALAAALVAGHATAGSRLAAPANPAHAEECGSCHLAYPPGLLPAPSWTKLMAGLRQHFGTDASIDAAATAAISRYLADHAATGKRASTVGEGLRVTESPWFVRKHRKVETAAWNRPSVKSAANCAACHPGAARADFDDHAVRVPR